MPALAATAEAFRRRGASPCTACGTAHDPGATHEERAAECRENRPACSMPDCDKRTCIQAMANGWPPLCLEDFFGGAGKRMHVMYP